MIDKKGQGLSLNVIIIAAIALVVLVVLIAIFTGRAGMFGKEVSKDADRELSALKVIYGSCHPTATAEAKFKITYKAAVVLEDSEQRIIETTEAREGFKDKIEECRRYQDSSVCSTNLCGWE